MCVCVCAAVVWILLYRCTTWTQTKRMEKKLNGNYTRMLRAILNKFWKQHPTTHQRYGQLPPITKIIQIRQTRHAGHCMDEQRQDDQLEPIYNRSVQIQDIALKTSRDDRDGWPERVREIRSGNVT